MPARPQGAANALKAPGQGDSRALKDLELQRRGLLKRLAAKKISPRDYAAISAELRKVNASIAIVEGQQANRGGIAEEELASRAQAVREKLLKTKAERDKFRKAVATARSSHDDEEPAEATG